MEDIAFSSFVHVKKKPKGRLSITSLGLVSKYKRRLMELKGNSNLLLYDLSGSSPRLATTIALGSTCVLKKGKAKGEEQVRRISRRQPAR